MTRMRRLQIRGTVLMTAGIFLFSAHLIAFLRERFYIGVAVEGLALAEPLADAAVAFAPAGFGAVG